jgi:Uma2 family endonuclease
MSSTAEDLIRRHRFTVADYYRMAEVGILAPDARVELIEGEVIEMPPIGAPHASVVNRLHTLLVETVQGHALVRGQSPLRLDRHNEPEPDLALVRTRPGHYGSRHPGP